MIVLKDYAAFALLGGIAAVSYFCGYYWRGVVERSRLIITSRPMTPEEDEAFRRAFDHMDKGFDELRNIGRTKL